MPAFPCVSYISTRAVLKACRGQDAAGKANKAVRNFSSRTSQTAVDSGKEHVNRLTEPDIAQTCRQSGALRKCTAENGVQTERYKTRHQSSDESLWKVIPQEPNAMQEEQNHDKHPTHEAKARDSVSSISPKIHRDPKHDQAKTTTTSGETKRQAGRMQGDKDSAGDGLLTKRR